ncbi:hypothetical protein TH66_12660 [Carbonactinospora thermoautotrophica]|uniref:Uncharacterized protein n=1 Tax=Carbonactinospora thermoautotrophica TaxID=1469144 RepID=A0A132N0K8_9ACTN|nr:hypothetical protein TH66_12660 [Carbonactinospora thermoautotrophica]KWX09084.1 hypothetical protein TR74_11750 [Carbonactinospora thermoautotrophica]
MLQRLGGEFDDTFPVSLGDRPMRLAVEDHRAAYLIPGRAGQLVGLLVVAVRHLVLAHVVGHPAGAVDQRGSTGQHRCAHVVTQVGSQQRRDAIPEELGEQGARVSAAEGTVESAEEPLRVAERRHVRRGYPGGPPVGVRPAEDLLDSGAARHQEDSRRAEHHFPAVEQGVPPRVDDEHQATRRP